MKKVFNTQGSLLIFMLLLAARSVYFSNTYVAGLQSDNIETFTDIFIPLLTISLHLALLRVFPATWYCVAAIADFVLEIGIATYHNYFLENIDIHLVLGAYSEGLQVAGYIRHLIPKTFLLIGCPAVALQCYLASRVKGKITWRILGASALVIMPLAILAVLKVPFWRARLVTDYTICIKVHGFYTAMISDLIASGRVPSDQDLIRELNDLQTRFPLRTMPFRIAEPHLYENLLAVQVESLDFNILNYRSGGKEVTPFFNSLCKVAILAKLNSFHYGASGSSGADFQFLTGKLPLQSFPTFKIRTLDYRDSLPASYASKGLRTLAFHGNTSSMWGRGYAYQKMRVARFLDASDYPRGDARWGISDRTFFKHSVRFIEENRKPGDVYFLITLSSHGPFDFVESAVFPKTDLVGKYFNAIHYADAAVADFLRTLQGKYLVIIYGDHSAGVRNQFYESGSDQNEYVPGFLFLLMDGTLSKPELDGSADSLLSGELDLRSLYSFARSSFP